MSRTAIVGCLRMRGGWFVICDQKGVDHPIKPEQIHDIRHGYYFEDEEILGMVMTLDSDQVVAAHYEATNNPVELERRCHDALAECLGTPTVLEIEFDRLEEKELRKVRESIGMDRYLNELRRL